MKKLIAMLLALTMVLALAACTAEPAPSESTPAPSESTPADETSKAMTYEEFMAAEADAEVTIESYVQATQGWWDNTIVIYLQGPDGAYFSYGTKCSEEDAAKLVPGTKVRITGTKAVFNGEVEVMDGTFEFVEGADTYVAEAMDATALLGTEELEQHMNKKVSFKGMTVEAIEYKNGEPGDDIYVTVSKDGNKYDFCVERYLTGPETEVYQTVGALAVGDKVDVTGFIYWYEGVNTHITGISK